MKLLIAVLVLGMTCPVLAKDDNGPADAGPEAWILAKLGPSFYAAPDATPPFFTARGDIEASGSAIGQAMMPMPPPEAAQPPLSDSNAARRTPDQTAPLAPRWIGAIGRPDGKVSDLTPQTTLSSRGGKKGPPPSHPSASFSDGLTVTIRPTLENLAPEPSRLAAMAGLGEAGEVLMADGARRTGRPGQNPWVPFIVSVAGKYGLPPRLLHAVILVESRYDRRAVSPKGAKGMMQLMPGTAGDLDVRDAFDARENVEAGARYLRSLIDRFGSYTLAVAAYNAGPGAVDKYRGVPPFVETRDYVRTIAALLDEGAREGDGVGER